MRVPVQICAAGPEAPGGTALRQTDEAQSTFGARAACIAELESLVELQVALVFGKHLCRCKATEWVKARKGLEVAQHALQRRLCSVLGRGRRSRSSNGPNPRS